MTDQPDGTIERQRGRQHKDLPLPVEPLSLRPNEAWRFLGISKSYGFELLKAGVLQRVPNFGRRATAITMESIKTFAEGRCEVALPPPKRKPKPKPRLEPEPPRPTVRRPRS